jgi:hypothetical protein
VRYPKKMRRVALVNRRPMADPGDGETVSPSKTAERGLCLIKASSTPRNNATMTTEPSLYFEISLATNVTKSAR